MSFVVNCSWHWIALDVSAVLVQRGTVILALLFVILSARVGAQQLEPRSYANTPVGMNFLIVGYGYASGGILADPTIPIENAEIENHELIFAYARSLDIAGMSGKFDVTLPYAWTSGSAELAGERRERQVSGWGAPKFRLSVNLYGAPALSFKEFASYQQDLIIGASLQVGVPLGQYDDDRLLNVGTNRWTVKPELGVSKAYGPLILELSAGATIYSDNADFLDNRTLSQDPLYSLQAHIIYGMKSGVWFAVDGTYYTGGSTTIDEMAGGERQSNSRAGLTIALPVNRHHSVKLFASTGVSARTGGDFDAVGMAWQCRWGGGL